MKFHITKTEDTRVPEPPVIEVSLKLVNYFITPIGWDDVKNEPIYGEVTPEEAEKVEHFRAYRVILLRHTKPESERTDPIDGLQQRHIYSTWFDSRDIENDKLTMTAALGRAMECCMGREDIL